MEHAPREPLAPSQATVIEPQAPEQPAEKTAPAEARQMPADWRQMALPVFVVEDSFYRSRIPRLAHWSIAWSDLMMTMFVVFLTLYVHQRTHQDILAHGQPNRVADETIPVQVDKGRNSLVFHPITQVVSKKTSEPKQEAEQPFREQTGSDVLIRHPAAEQETKPEPPPAPPAPTPQEAPEPPPREVITDLYDLSKVTVASEKLEKFASVELVPDKTMRISLTGDLLFPSGQAELTPAARDSLKKLAGIVKKTPYMVNVIGHTDDRPVRTARFPSNWELSLARASQVARFLIDETGLPASQFAVSGFASFRPLTPNDNEEHRKTNRRVEIILSQEPPQALKVSPETIHAPGAPR